MIINEVQAYQITTAIQIHFKTKKFIYGGARSSAALNPEKHYWDNEPRKGIYRRLAREYQTDDRLEMFLAGNLIYFPRSWIGDLIDSEECRSNYRRMKKVKAALTRTVLEDVKILMKENPLKYSFAIDGDLPYYIKASRQRIINPETAVIFNYLFNDFKRIDKELGENHIFWEDVRLGLTKFSRFVTVPTKDKLENIRNAIFELL